MKKSIHILLAIIGTLFFSSFAVAKNIDNNKPVSFQQLPAGASTAVCSNYPTCITVTNYSYSTISISVPALSVFTSLPYGYMQAIQSYDYNYKQVILYDWTGYPFFNEYVPNHYDIIVEDYAGKLKVATK